MTLPNFLIIGAQKAGYSWLAYNLRQHPAALTLKKVCDFLGVDSSFQFQQINKEVNKNKALLTEAILSYYLPFMRPINPWLAKLLPKLNFNTCIDKETILKLQNIYTEENEKLFALLQRRIDSWS